jgi:hypothetical protein
MLESVARQLALGTLLFALTVALAAFATVWVLGWRKRHLHSMLVRYSPARGVVHVTAITLGLFTMHLLQMAMWAGVFVAGGAFESGYRALYFSMSCFSTLGFADTLAPPGWELIASIEAVVGSLMMGWSAGILFAAAHSFQQSVLNRKPVQILD